MNPMRRFFGGGNSGMGSQMNNGGGRFGNIANALKLLPQFMNDPIGAMLGTGINIPQNIRGNPEAITNYLRSSGQMTDEQYDQVSPLASMAQAFFGNGRR